MTRKDLIKNWGPEVILRCSCADYPSHSMNGTPAKCPTCKQQVQILVGDSWESIRENYPR